MRLEEPALLVFVAAAAAAGLLSVSLLLWRWRQVQRFRARGGGVTVLRESRLRPLLKAALVVGAIAVLAFAAARPQFGSETTEIRQEGVALSLAVDVSLSMAATDLAPDRLAAVRREIGGLLDRLQGDRVGLVLFAGTPFPRFPLTRDLAAVREVANSLRPGVRLVEPGSDIAAAIELARAQLERSEAETKAIILISDGEALQGDALAAAAAAAASGVRLFSAGAGTAAGSTIPLAGRDELKIDATTGRPVITRLDAQALTDLANAGGGRFVRLEQEGALASLASDLAALEANVFRQETDSVPIERFQIFAAIALALLVIEPLLGDAARTAGGRLRRRLPGSAKRGAAAGLIATIALTAGACATDAFERNAAGSESYDAGRYEAALADYRAAQARSPGDPRLSFNAGRALHALGEYERAVTATTAAIGADAALTAQAFYNLGNHRIAQGDLVAAESAYIEALRLDPGDFDAKFNLELVQRLRQPEPAASAPAEEQPPDGPASSDQPPEEATPGAPPPDASPSEMEGAVMAGEGTAGDDEAGDPAAGAGTPGDDDPASDATEDGDGQADRAAGAERLEQALEALDREMPTLEQALAILDALREAGPEDRLTVDAGRPDVSGVRDW